ncbi:MAG TPA: ribosome maturation factor RimP, partial [Acidobacteriota bacterium]
EIQEIADKVLTAEGMEQVDLEFKAGKSRSLLRILIDKASGITLNDCENISRQLSALLDVKDLIQGAYILEVSSPGVDRPFKTERDYQRALGKVIRVSFANDRGEAEQATGKLARMDDQKLVLEEAGNVREIARESVRKAQQELVFSRPKSKPGKKR